MMTATYETFLEVAIRLPGEACVFGLRLNYDWAEVRRFEPTGENGRAATLWVVRWPAMFWRVTSGDLEITTGSGDEVGRLAWKLAEALAVGMIGIHLPARPRLGDNGGEEDGR
jgi:hypothetical protein